MKYCKAQEDIKVEYVLPVRLITQEKADNTELLLEEHPRQAFLGELPVCHIGKDGYVVYDFGEEFCGGVDIAFQGMEGAGEGATGRVRVVFGESVGEAMSTIRVDNSTNDHSPRDIVIDTGFWSHQQVGNTGFRFVKIQPIDGDINVASLQGISRIRPYEYKGSFTCSDERLNKIWKVGARTVHLNMQEFLWDGIKRDRLVWIGDCHPETSTASMVFGETDVVKKSLDFVRNSTPIPNYMNGLPSYSMWWLRIHRDFYWDCGNFEYLCQQKDYIKELVENVISTVENGKTSIKNFFVDHSSIGTPDDEAGLYSMLIIGLEAGAEMLEIMGGEEETVKKALETAEILKGNSFSNVKNKNCAALTAISGLEDLGRICKDVLIPGGIDGVSTFLGYYVLISLFKDGKTQVALDYIRELWGAMIEHGGTTFWEECKLDWIENSVKLDEVPSEEKKGVMGDWSCYVGYRLSLCHGWASGPTSFLSRYVLGVKALEPGYKKISIEPNLGDLDYACGEVPTPYGKIRVFHKKVCGKVMSEYELPFGVELI